MLTILTSEFIQARREELPWVKRCVNITDEWWEGLDKPTRDACFHSPSFGDTGPTKLSTKGRSASEATCALEVYLPAVVLVSSPTSIWELAELMTSPKLLLMECLNCVPHIPRLVLERLVSISTPRLDKQVGLGCLVLPTSSAIQCYLRAIW